MNLFDIVGPVMVGPSSSHTAGAVKIGRISRKLIAEDVIHAEIFFHGSFQATGKGHGTDKALIAGLLGFDTDDERIPRSFQIAGERGLDFTIEGLDLGEVHPNTVKLIIVGVSGRKMEILASSIGGGQIRICEINGLAVNFSGDSPTLIVHSQDQQGLLQKVVTELSNHSVNIAGMQVYRAKRGGHVVTVIECDEEVSEEVIEKLENFAGVVKGSYLSLLEDGHV